MSCDKLVYDLANEVGGSPSVFMAKDWIQIMDNQNQNYASNQITLDTSQLSNSAKYMSYREAYLEVPVLLTVGADGVGASQASETPATSCDRAVSLKNWFGNLIHSMVIEYNGTTIVQQTPFQNLHSHWKLESTFSWDDVHNQGHIIGLYPDDPTTFSYHTANTPEGIGHCNNRNLDSEPAVAGAHFSFNKGASGAGNYNLGLKKRQDMYIYDPAGALGSTDATGTADDFVASSLQSETNTKNIYRSYVSAKVNGDVAVRGYIQFSIMATIYLKHLHSFFQSVPLLKGAYMKMTFNINNSTTKFACAGNASGAITLQSVSVPVGGVNPLMISSALGNNGARNICTAGAGDNFIADVSVGATCLSSELSGVNQGQLAKSVHLHLPSYVFNPTFEGSYLSNPVKEIVYEDIYQYQVLNIGADQVFNNLITNGIANLKHILIVPYHSTTGAENLLPAGTPSYRSPFNGCGAGSTDPYISINNFQVIVSGKNEIHNTQKYSFEAWNNQIFGQKSVNGNQVDGIQSGLINRLGFDTTKSFQYVDISRMLPNDRTVPKSVQISGTNQSAKAIDLYVFLCYGTSFKLDVFTGTRTM